MNKKLVNFNYYDGNTKTLDVSLCIDYKISLNRKCSGCPFFTGERCHGHGDYFGTCKLIELLDLNYYHSICYDSSTCLLKDRLIMEHESIIYDFYKKSNEVKEDE